MKYSDYDNIYVNEAYIGKSETLKEIEDQIGVMREKALKKFTDINKSPEVLKLNRLFEKQFGMECYCLYVSQSEIMDGHTSVIQTKFDIAFKKNISKYVEGNQNTGYRWKKDNGLCITTTVSLGLLRDEAITNSEIVAILLHELGHNFADAIYDDIKYDNMAFMYLYGSALIYNTIAFLGLTLPSNISKYNNANNKYLMKKGKRKTKNIFRGIFEGLKSTKSDNKNFVKSVINRLSGKTLQNIKNYKMYQNSIGMKEYQRTKSLDRQNEVIADKFAAIYGYGPELITGLKKMGDWTSKAYNFINNLSFIDGDKINLAIDLEFIGFEDYDCHGNLINRAYSEINLLKRELSKADIDPKLVKEMTSQLNQLEKIVNDSIKYSKNATEYEKQLALYYKLTNDQCPAAVVEEVEDAIEEAFDKALNNN